MSDKPETKQRSQTIRLPKRVVILGADVTAWMAAALLGRHFQRLGCRITVVSGGESSVPFRALSSLPSLVGLIRNLGVDEHEMMRDTRATYKLATQLSDWVQPERDSWLPFGFDRVRIEGLSLFDAWFAERSQGRLLRPFHSYSLHWAAALAGKSPHAFAGESPFATSGQYGLHVDTIAFTGWLRTVALKFGVEEICGDITKVFPNGRGGIAQVRLQDSVAVPGNLFLDCRTATDTQNKTAAIPDDSTDTVEPCDRLVSFRVPGIRQVPPYTQVIGQASGWAWRIPLAEEVDCGYLFSSKSLSDDQALQQLRDVCLTSTSQDEAEQVDPYFADFHPVAGRDVFWKDNVVTLGMAASYLEPLAMTNLHLWQVGVELLMELFPERSGSRASREEYNRRMQTVIREARDFTQLHYALSQRDDTTFWQTAGGLTLSDELQHRLAVYDASGATVAVSAESVPELQYQYLLAGCGRLPQRAAIKAASMPPARIQQVLRELVKTNETILKDLPLHEELLDWIHTKPFQQQTA